jgi:CheY-like chemotaxis protein
MTELKQNGATIESPAPPPPERGGQFDFLDTISRQIRRPLNGVLAVTELLRRQPLTPDAQAYVNSLEEHYRSLLQIVADAEDMARASSGHLIIQNDAVELRALVDEIQVEWAGRTQQTGLAVSISYDGPDLQVYLDGARLKQVFDHLLARATSVTRRGGVEASLRAEPEGDTVILTGCVRDSGPALRDDQLEGLFEPSNGLDGVNLPLCRSLLQAMDSDLRVDRNSGSGIAISFEVAAREVEKIEVSETNGQVTERSVHVLVVDDNATNRMVAEALCEMFECTSESAEDGVEAVEAARSGRFDIILMDIKMPRMDGVQATREIRAFDGLAGEVPIIALTANADPEDAVNYLASGMSSVVEKPIKPEALLAAMNACLPEAEAPTSAANSAAA